MLHGWMSHHKTFAVLTDSPASSDPGVRGVADAGVAEAAAAAHTSRVADGNSPARPHSMTLRPRRANGAKARAHPTHSTKRKMSHTTCQRTSSRQTAIKQQAARLADSRSASQQTPADGRQQTHGERDDSMTAPRAVPPSRTAKRKCPPALGSGRPSTRRRIDHGGHQTVRPKRKRRDSPCITSDRPRTRQRIAEQESCDSKRTIRRMPRKLTPCEAKSGVPFDPG